MSLIPWKNKGQTEPSRSLMTQFRTEMDRLFDRFFRDPWGGLDEAFHALGSWHPSLDVTEDDKHVTVRADLPGVDPEDMNLSVTRTALTLSGEKREEREEKKGMAFWAERRFGSFYRQIQLPAEVDDKDVDAQYENGVLTVRLRKLHTESPRKVQIKVSNRR